MGPSAAPQTGKLKGLPKETDNDTMEKSAIVLPILQNGVIALGDLWDCRSCTAIGNLFDKPLREEHLEAHPISVLKYRLQRAKTAKDYVAEMHISVSLSLEAAGGQVKVTGKAHFDREERQKFDQEVILCNYDLTTYEVRLRPNATTADDDEDKNVLSKKVIELLNNGTISATHYVQSVTLGGQAQASITYYEKLDHSHMSLGGSLDGTITIGPVTATAKASLDLLNSETNENINTDILIKAQPRLNSAPTDCAAMFKEIEKMDETIEQEQHFPQLTQEDDPDGTPGRKIIGIPIKFRLMPLNRIEQVLDTEDTYQLMKQELLDNFSEMLLTLEDYGYEDYLKQLLREDVPAIVPILQDDNHPITQELRAFSDEIVLKAQELKRDAVQLFSDYKYGLVTEVDLQNCLNKYNEDIRLPEIAATVAEFGRRGRMELADIRSQDVINLTDSDGRPTVSFFTNESDMTEWYNQERTIKILLQTASQSNSNGIFQRLFQMSGPLRDKNGAEVGIAFPGISKNFSLTMKTSKAEIMVRPEEMVFALDLFRLATDTSTGDIFNLFFAIHSELTSVKVPLQSEILNEFPTFMNIMRTFMPKDGNVFISETYCDLLANLSGTLDTWNFVCPMDAVNRGVDMIKAFKKIRGLFKPATKHNWFFAKFDILSKFSSPLLFVFRDDILTSICYDMLDVSILVHCLQEAEGHNWETISVAQASKSCVYIDQWNYSTEVVPKVVLEQYSFLSDPLTSNDSFPANNDPKLQDALEILRGLASRKDVQVFTSVVHFALRDFELELEPILVEHCKWADNTVTPNGFKDIEWPAFADDIRGVLQTGTPNMILIHSIHAELKKLIEPPEEIPDIDVLPGERDPEQINIIMHEKINKAVNFKTNGDSQLEEVRKMIEKYPEFVEKDEPEEHAWVGLEEPEEPERVQWFARRDDMVAGLQAFLIDGSANEVIFHLYQLSQVADQISLEGSISKSPISLAKAYCDRVQIDSVDYPSVRDSLDTSLSKGQLFKALSTLDSITVHSKLHVFQSECELIKAIPAPLNAKSILEKMIEYNFENEQLEVIWENPKFLHLIRTSLNNQGMVETLFIHLSTFFPVEEDDGEPQFPMFIPQDVSELVRPLYSRKISSSPSFPWNTEWDGNILKFVNQLKIFVARIAVPDNFQEVFTKNLIEGGGDLEYILGVKNALMYWDKDNHVFKYNWTILAVKNAINRLQSYVSEKFGKKRHMSENCCEVLQISATKLLSAKAGDIEIIEHWKLFAKDGIIPTLTYLNFSSISKTQIRPTKLSYGHLEQFCSTILPYVVENLRSLNAGVLTPSFLQRLVSYPIPGYNPGQINFGTGIHDKSLGFQFTRDDFFTALLQTSDVTVAQQILQIIHNRRLAMPLVINNIIKDQAPKYTSLFMPLQSIIDEKRCFRLLTKPYRFVLTLRIGETMAPNVGRSSLINRHLMKRSDTFNSFSNIGSNLGKSLSRNGYLEFITLSESTSEGIFFWPEINAKYGHLKNNEPMHLGIFHGNALDIPQKVYKHLTSIVTSIVVFWDLGNMKQIKESKQKLSTLLKPFSNVLDIVLYPDPTVVNSIKDENLIFLEPPLSTNPGIVDRLNSAKLRRIVSEAFEYTFSDDVEISTEIISSDNPVLKSLPSPSTSESQLFLNIIRDNSVKKVKYALSVTSVSKDALATTVIEAFFKVLALEKSNREIALHHIFFELDSMSRKSSLEIRNKIKELRNEILNGDENNIETLQQQVKVHLEKLQLNILTQQTLFYSAGLYLSDSKPIDSIEVKEFTSTLAEGILAGYPVEIEDSCKTTFLPLFQQVIALLSEKIRVFTLSIIGIKDSGKSTLLNRLYGGSRGFSEFSCTKGITLKLLWVNDDLRPELECDAFVILDSEGISAPENEGDPSAYNGDPALQKERQLITFILSMSDLTLINTRGGQVGQLPFILESSLTTVLKNNVQYSGIEKFQISPPDLHIIYQTDSEISLDLDSMLNKFTESFDSVRSVSSDLVNLGLISKSADRLVQMNSMAFKSNASLTIPPLNSENDYHQGIASLRELIENKCKQSRSNKPGRLTLSNWLQTSTEVWAGLQNQINIPLSTTALKTEMSFYKRFLQAKFALSKAFCVHEERIWNNFFVTDIDTIFEGHFIPGFDKALDILLNKVSRDLLQVPNTCQASSSEIKRKRRRNRALRSGSVNPDACDECRAAFSLREDLIEEVENGAIPGSFLVVEDIYSLTDQIRHETYNRFESNVLARNIKDKKSEHLSLFVKNLTGIESTVVYQKFIEHLYTLRFLPNSVELFHSEFEIVYRNLKEQIVEPNNPFENSFEKIPDLKTVHVFDVSPYYSESSYAIPFPENRNKLTWDQDAWLQIQLSELPTAIIKEFGVKGLYKWGMAMILKSRVDEILELLAEKIGRPLDQFQLNFIWLVHIVGAKLFYQTLDRGQQTWKLGNDPVSVMELCKRKFIKDPTTFFCDYYKPEELLQV